MRRPVWIAILFAASAAGAGCKKRSESKPAASERPERAVPNRDFSAGPLAGSDRPERDVPSPRRGAPDRDPGGPGGRDPSAGSPAMPGGGGGGRGGWKGRREEFDTDGDGQLSETERDAM